MEPCFLKPANTEHEAYVVASQFTVGHLFYIKFGSEMTSEISDTLGEGMVHGGSIATKRYRCSFLVRILVFILVCILVHTGTYTDIHTF